MTQKNRVNKRIYNEEQFHNRENKIHDTSELVKKTDYNTKIAELENKIPSFSGLVTTSALTAVENKLPDVSILVKKTDYDTNIAKILDHNHEKYINTPEFNKHTAQHFAARLNQKLKGLNPKINSNTKKHLVLLKELKKLKTFDSTSLIGKSHGTQNDSVFQPMYRYLKKIGNTDQILSWKSKGLSDETIKPPTTSDNSIAPALSYYRSKTIAKFTGSCLKQDKITYTHGKIYIVYE